MGECDQFDCQNMPMFRSRHVILVQSTVNDWSVKHECIVRTNLDQTANGFSCYKFNVLV